VDPRREAKLARASAKGPAPPTAMPPPVAPAAATRLPSPLRVTETAVSGTGGAGQELSVDDLFDA
jgi:N-acetyl-gamma-glutamylphosphate reductase